MGRAAGARRRRERSVTAASRTIRRSWSSGRSRSGRSSSLQFQYSRARPRRTRQRPAVRSRSGTGSASSSGRRSRAASSPTASRSTQLDEDDFRRTHRFAELELDRTREELSARGGGSVTRGALDFVLSHPAVTGAIVGVRNEREGRELAALALSARRATSIACSSSSSRAAPNSRTVPSESTTTFVGTPRTPSSPRERLVGVEEDRPLDAPHLAEALDLGPRLRSLPDVDEHYLDARPGGLARCAVPRGTAPPRCTVLTSWRRS